MASAAAGRGHRHHAADVVRYFKNERFGFSVTYYEGNRPGSTTRTSSSPPAGANGEEIWLAETKGEIRPNTALKSEAARLWCEKISGTKSNVALSFHGTASI